MKQLTVFLLVLAVAAGAYAAPTGKAKASRAGKSSSASAAAKASAGEEAEEASDVDVRLEQFPKLGSQATLAAPNLGGGTNIGQAWNGKPRKWIVLESKYSTKAKCIDQLTFTWHVLLETKTATAKDKEGQAKLAQYSYFNTSVTYGNIPRGTHAASVCLHPSYLEQYGEPKAVGLVVTDSSGKMVTGDSVSEIEGIKSKSKFWEDSSIMEAKKNGEPLIERRQGLQDRSKTIWGLVNPNDYELVIQ